MGLDTGEVAIDDFGTNVQVLFLLKLRQCLVKAKVQNHSKPRASDADNIGAHLSRSTLVYRSSSAHLSRSTLVYRSGRSAAMR